MQPVVHSRIRVLASFGREDGAPLPAGDIPRDERGLTPIAFSRLLQWLDDGASSHGDTYLEIRRRLVAYFDRRNRPSADELADQTLNRIGRTLEETGTIATRPPARYCYVVAKFVLLEDIRRGQKQVSLDEPWRADAVARAGRLPGPDEGSAIQEHRLDCLDRCLQKLKPEQRELVVEYYRDTLRQKIERRQALAQRLGISMNALGIRASRIRGTLEACMLSSCNGELKDFPALDAIT